jgi:hypothetical protein
MPLKCVENAFPNGRNAKRFLKPPISKKKFIPLNSFLAETLRHAKDNHSPGVILLN